MPIIFPKTRHKAIINDSDVNTLLMDDSGEPGARMITPAFAKANNGKIL